MAHKVLLTLLVVVGVLTTGGFSHVANKLSLIGYENIAQAPDASINLVASPSVLNQNGDVIQVSWSNVHDPSEEDWIGIYSPALPSNYSAIAPVRYEFASLSPNYMQSGNGTFAFRLVNMRADYSFAFFRNGLSNPQFAQQSNVVTNAFPAEPLQGHLSLTSDPTQMRITWVSGAVESPQFQWGEQSQQYPYSALAEAGTYNVDYMCGAPATTVGYRDPGIIYTAVATGLQPGTAYFYRFGDPVSGFSAEYVFQTAPLPAETVKVIAFGDMGTAPTDGSTVYGHTPEKPALNTSANILSELADTNLLLHIGDISYARGYASDWDMFFDMIEPIATAVPYMVGIGNHERDFPGSGDRFHDVADSGGECGVPYINRFIMPTSWQRSWYSFDHGPVHYVMMSTEVDFSVGSPQYVFLKNDLQNVDRSVTPWVIFTGHRPMYIDSDNNQGEGSDQVVAQQLRESVEPLLFANKVDVAFWGHHHSYQRSCPIFNVTCQDGGTVHVVIGMAGQELSQNLLPVPPSWLIYVDDEEYGYSRMTISPTQFSFEYVANKDQTVKDSFTLDR